MYLSERLNCIPPGRFIEIGPGSGEITHRLLKAGWSGTVYDLSEETIAKLKQRFIHEIASGQLALVVGDFASTAAIFQQDGPVDLVISCMVMEHLDAGAEKQFMELSAIHLKAGGLMIGLVPASQRHWSIEDDIAGHYRRYSRESLLTLLRTTGWKASHVAGLTYPVSNLLQPLSYFLVQRHEANKLHLSSLERTKCSGLRKVRFKTHFPSFLGLLLNEHTMLPLHWIQKLFSNSRNALILYFEATHEIRETQDY